MTACAICTVLLGLHTPAHSVSYAEAHATCVAVATAAEASGEDPIEAAAQAGIESRWNARAVSPHGCRGPLQVLARYWCPGRRAEGCDLVQAGIEARRVWRDAARRRWGRRSTAADALCAYAMGHRYGGGGCRYARQVLELARSARALGGSP